MVRYLGQVEMEKIVSLAKRRGFIFQSSEIYGGLGGCWDYGPLGVELKRNIKEAWWRSVVWSRDDVVGLDASILMHPRTWVASGHVEGFQDPMVDCRVCRRRWRADDAKDGRCPHCGGELTEPRMFNLMFRTYVGPVDVEAEFTGALDAALGNPEAAGALLRRLKEELERATVYLRPETAQGIFVNFDNVLTTSRKKLPFGIAQIGKAFRNEVTFGNFTFRSREFEQMEIEYFVKPGTDEEWHRRWVEERFQWYVDLGIRKENLKLRRHEAHELAHYAKDCYDIEYRFPWGWSELEGIANRTDFDLRRHAQYSGKSLTYFDEDSQKHLIPYVIEPSGGVDRAALAFLVDAYDEEPDKEETRVLLRFHPAIAPVKVAVLPLSRNPRLVPLAREVYTLLRGRWMVWYDDAQSIGRRYRRQDEIGTPYCVTIDFESLEDKAVTIRDRDTMQQIRVPIEHLPQVIASLLEQDWDRVAPHYPRVK